MWSSVERVVLACTEELDKSGRHFVPHVMATVDGVDRQCLIDTGAGVSIIPRSLLRPEALNQGSSTQLHTANGQALRVHGTATLDIKLDSWEGAHTFLVADVSTGVILGVDFLHAHDIDVLVSRHRLQWRGGSELFNNRQAPIRTVVGWS